jgi:MazG family protein
VIEPQPDATPPSPPSRGNLDEALQLVEYLRAHCSWDAVQTHHSLRRYLLEEAHEVVDAIDTSNDEALRDELGDLLLNLAFQIVVAEERTAFDRSDVVETLQRKMRRRHPHIYGDGEAVPWEELKAAERGSEEPESGGVLRDIVSGTDPLAHAHRIQAKVASVGFDWANARGAWEKVREEIEEVGAELAGADTVRLEEELGDLLFAIVNLTRLSGVDATTALRRANVKFSRRFGKVESHAADRGIALESAGLELLDAIWNDVKREEG